MGQMSLADSIVLSRTTWGGCSDWHFVTACIYLRHLLGAFLLLLNTPSTANLAQCHKVMRVLNFHSYGMHMICSSYHRWFLQYQCFQVNVSLLLIGILSCLQLKQGYENTFPISHCLRAGGGWFIAISQANSFSPSALVHCSTYLCTYLYTDTCYNLMGLGNALEECVNVLEESEVKFVGCLGALQSHCLRK